jgi:NADH-quinone oxidoreductase subunit L
MFLACGVGAFAAGIFHLMTHAFFKALLFLGSGSVIHALSGEQDMRNMGDLYNKIPVTAKTFWAGMLAIAGIFPLAGFFSKDEILWQSFSSELGVDTHRLLWLIGAVTAFMTAFYMSRLVHMTFHGKSRVAHEVEHHIHEAPPSMRYVLVALAFLSVVGGWIGWPAALGGSNRFEHFLEPVVARAGEAHVAAEAVHHDPTEYFLMIFSLALAVGGIWLARRWYHENPEVPERLATSWPRLHRLVYRKYYMDEIYDALFVNRTMDLGTSLATFDRGVIDGVGVDGSAWLTRFTSRVSILWDTWVVDGSVNLGARIVWLFSFPARLVQNGLVQSYALLFMTGVLLFLGYYFLLH